MCASEEQHWGGAAEMLLDAETEECPSTHTQRRHAGGGGGVT